MEERGVKVAEKPIIFSTSEVRAILEGRKTQTRRVIKPQTPNGYVGDPPYKPGDLLWVREEVSKIWLKVEDIKVSRLQDITPWEAIQEGIEPKGSKPCQFGDYEPVWKNYLYPKEPEKWLDSAVDSFRTLWDSINAKHGYGWDINPWVWRIEFKVVKD